MILRRAELKDSKDIANVLLSSYNIKDLKEAQQVFINETKKHHNYIIAEVDNKIVGIATWKMHGLPKHMLCELDRIAVLEEFRGKGVSKQLFDTLIKDANIEYGKQGHKLRKLYLLTHDNNERAQAFYRKIGFTHETTLKKHYYDDKDEFVYSIFFK